MHVVRLCLDYSQVNITLTPAELARIDEVSPLGVAAGDRYADMSSVNR